MQTILVPLDGSKFAERALTVAVPVAQENDATLVLMTALAVATRAPDAIGAPDSAEGGKDTVRTQLRSQLERIARRLGSKHNIKTATHFREGPILDQILAVANETQADLIVMASHGRSGLSRMWLGSVTDALLRQTRTPVLVVRSARPWTLVSHAEPLYPRVLVALDGSEHSERALRDTIALIGDAPCELLLTRVQPGLAANVNPPSWIREVTELHSTQYLAPLAAKYAGPNRTFVHRVVVDDDPARALLAVAKKDNAFLMSLATHGRSNLQRAVLGSVADKVIRGASLPVLVSPPEPKA